MAAKIFLSLMTILIFLAFLAFYSNLSSPDCKPRLLSALNIIFTRTRDKFWPNFVQALLLYRTNKSLRLTGLGFHNSRTAIVKWTMRGLISMVIPGHDPPLEIIIWISLRILALLSKVLMADF